MSADIRVPALAAPGVEPASATHAELFDSLCATADRLGFVLNAVPADDPLHERCPYVLTRGHITRGMPDLATVALILGFGWDPSSDPERVPPVKPEQRRRRRGP